MADDLGVSGAFFQNREEGSWPAHAGRSSGLRSQLATAPARCVRDDTGLWQKL